MKKLIPIILLIIMQSCESEQSSQGEDFLGNVNQIGANITDDSELLHFFDQVPQPIKPAFVALPQGSTKPEGWLLEIMKEDLESGVVGALDELYPGIKADDLYRSARRGGLEDVPEMGDLQLTGEAWETSIMWWNAETIGNWWDGFVRHAFLTRDEAAIEQSHAIVQNLLASQDEDGYIGIYKASLRYQHKGSNGELWAQTTAFRMLLAYYEITQKAEVLQAVEKAMTVTMQRFSDEGRNPFLLENAFGGVTHGLMMTDVCETLYRITGKQAYQEYATYLYRAFSTYSINRAFNDMRYPYLQQKDSLFTGHGVHTYEHLRTLINAYYNTGYPELKTAWENALYKLDQCILPSGAGHGNEWIAALPADPTFTSTEFCCMLELRNFYGSAFQKTGSVSFADQAEKLTFNAIMGARNADGSAITYGKGDNCYRLDGHHHGEEDSHEDVRYKYSPTHSDPAVCCVPNYSRNFSYYLDQMWLQAEDGLVAALYGPSVLETTWQGKSIRIEQQTQYPHSDEIRFKLSMDEPIKMAIYLRQPQWSEPLQLKVEDANIEQLEGFYKLSNTWQDGAEIVLRFPQEIKRQQFSEQEVYYQRGPLVYALPIAHREETIKTYEGTDFRDYYCLPLDSDYQDVRFAKQATVAFEQADNSEDAKLWQEPNMRLKVATQAKEEVELVPMGATVLRRVSFPILEE